MPTHPAPEPPAPLEATSVISRHRTTLALAVLCAAVFLAALDQTMVVTVLPAIMRTLHIPYTKLNDAAWIVTGYLLGYTVAMPLFGRLADVRGRRLMFMAALGVFALGSVLCVLAGELRWLVAARVIQAAGGGALVPVAMVVAVGLLPERRAFALGLVGASAEAGGVLGPLYGATLSQIWG
ncbi:MAG TPA: MFS transporter, partial [Thermoleophilia bacterium]|nr:MFS transporter [Thermoleophilia bacterium]